MDFVFRVVTKPEDVQYMKFDSEGNLYLYEPGAGISGEPHRVIEFGSDEIIYDCKEIVKKEEENKPKVLKVELFNRVVPLKGSSVFR